MPHIKPTPIGRARPSCGNRIVTAGPGLTMRTFTLITALSALVLATTAQQFGGGNYLENDYVDFQEPSRPAPPPPQRSYSRPAPAPAAPVRSSQSFASSSGPRPTPVPILKQINRHNEDGSYTYGYEGADGSFKIETKLTTGEVMGKYGYVDDLGKVRVVEYGANKFGFQPSGEGITVAPPTLVDETKRRPSADQPDYDDGQYYEQAPPPRPAPRAQQRPLQQAPQRAAPPPLPQRPVARPPPPPPPQTYEHVYEAPEPQYQPAPPPAPRRPAPSGLGPVPPRAQIPGAVPVGGASTGGVVYSQPQPRPVRPQLPPSPPPRPSPVYNSQPPPPPSPPRPQARSAGGGAGILDQLARDYALPQSGAAATADVSFGYY